MAGLIGLVMGKRSYPGKRLAALPGAVKSVESDIWRTELRHCLKLTLKVNNTDKVCHPVTKKGIPAALSRPAMPDKPGVKELAQ